MPPEAQTPLRRTGVRVTVLDEDAAVTTTPDKALQTLRRNCGGFMLFCVLMAVITLLFGRSEGVLRIVIYGFLAAGATLSGVYWAIQAFRLAVPRTQQRIGTEQLHALWLTEQFQAMLKSFLAPHNRE